MSNSVDPDETAQWAVSSGSMLFAKAITKCIIACDSEKVKPVLLARNLALNSDAAPNYKYIFCLQSESSTSSVKHHSETHIVKNTVLKQSKGLNVEMSIWSQNTRKPQKIPQWARPQTLIVRCAPFKTNLEGNRHLLWGLTYRRVINEGSKVINNNWVNNHSCLKRKTSMTRTSMVR